MNACLVFTVLLNLLCQQLDPRLRWPALGVGLLATWWFAIHYVAHTIHPLPEAIAGALIGSVAACVFVLCLKPYNVSHVPRPALTLGLAVVIAFSCMPKYTAERLLDRIAITSVRGTTGLQAPVLSCFAGIKPRPVRTGRGFVCALRWFYWVTRLVPSTVMMRTRSPVRNTWFGSTCCT